MRIVITDAAGLVGDAEIDVPYRKVESLMIDDAKMDRAMIGLSVLSGCVAAILEEVALAKKGQGSTSPGSMRPAATATTTRPDVPVCEGGCE